MNIVIQKISERRNMKKREVLTLNNLFELTTYF